MAPAHWQALDERIAGRPGDRTRHCPSGVGDRRPPTACRRRGGDDSSTIELRLYLPRRSWHFTFTRKSTAPVAFRAIVQTDDDRDQVAARAVS
jgi:hypothetical protein